MKNKIVAFALFTCFLAACNNKKEGTSAVDTSAHAMMDHDHSAMQEPSADPRVKDVMAIHDSIMPFMGAILNLRKEIAVQLKTTDSLLAVKPSEVLRKRKEKGLTLSTQLERADHEMMEWMHQYKADTLAKLSEKDAGRYIADQKKKIEAVRDLTNKSMEDAQQFIREQ